MASYNKVILMGNLTRDPETRITTSGSTIAKLGLALSRKYKTQSGEEREEVCFVDVDCFGKQAEVISKYFTKGKPIMLEGRLKLDQWQDSTTGQNRTKLGVILESFQFVGNKDATESNGSSSQNDYYNQKPTSKDNTDDDDDIPF